MERSPALLTSAQRQGLIQGLDPSSSDRKKRQRIRERLRNSAIDLQLAFALARDEDLERAFRPNLESLIELRDDLSAIEDELNTFERYADNQLSQLQEIRYELQEIDELHMQGKNVNHSEVAQETRKSPQAADRRTERAIEQASDTVRKLTDDLFQEMEFIRYQLSEHDDRVHHILENEHKYRMLIGNEYEDVKNSIDSKNTSVDHFDDLFTDISKLHGIIDPESDDDISPEDVEQALRITNKLLQKLETRRPGRQFRKRYAGSAIIDDLISSREFASGLDDSIVDAIAFFIRAADLAGADTESLIETAVARHYDMHRPDRVTDTVDMTIEHVRREMVLESAEEKVPSERYSNAELRALAEQENGISVQHTRERFIEQIIHDPDQLEEGLIIDDIQVGIEFDDIEMSIDLVGRLGDDVTVLIETLDNYGEEGVETTLLRLREFVDRRLDEADDELRAMLVLPSQSQYEMEESHAVQDILDQNVEIRYL